LRQVGRYRSLPKPRERHPLYGVGVGVALSDGVAVGVGVL